MIIVTTHDGDDRYPGATRYIATEHNALIIWRGPDEIAFYGPGMFSKVVKTDDAVEPEVPPRTHRAAIEYSVPPHLKIIAVGDEQFVRQQLDHWLVDHPVRPYDDSSIFSGGIPRILAVVT